MATPLDPSPRPHPHWHVAEALAHELDLATSLAMSDSLRPLFPTFRAAVEALPEAWFQQGRELLTGLEGDVYTVLGRLVAVLGGAEETDYGQLTLGLREATTTQVMDGCRTVAQSEGLELPPDLGALQALVVVTEALERAAGRSSPPESEGARRLRRECTVALSTCRDAPSPARFWYWLDRFHHEVYRPWRSSRVEFMEGERRRALAALGGQAGQGVPPLAWLTAKNPLLALSPTHDRVVQGQLSVVFHVEPFGIWDAFSPLPGAGLFTFAMPGEIHAAFRDRAEDIAGRLKALSDPTRLTMLRIVRATEVDNSDVAAYLDLSHPTVSVHARLLREAGLVESRRDGRRVLHRLDPEGVRRLLREVESFLGIRASPEEG